MTDLEEAAAYLAIDRLLRRYADLSTRGTYGELADLATPDALFTFETIAGQRFEVSGTEAFIEFANRMIGAASFFEYVPLNFVVDFEPNGVARGRAYNLEISYDAEKNEHTNHYGCYEDEYVRVDGRWFFERRDYRTVARRTNDLIDLSPVGFRDGGGRDDG